MQKSARFLLIIITAGFLLATLVKTFYLSNKYGGTDLRCRIVGTRLLTTDHSPYFYQWKPGESLFYLDPNAEAHRLVNGNVVTPAVSAVIYPLAQLPYPKVRLWWTILQVLAALGLLHILFRKPRLSDAFLLAAPIILGFICSDLWFYNIERGQMYIFYALILTAMYGCYVSKWKHAEFISGLIGGLFILFRPFTGIIGLGFLLHGKFKWVFGCISGCIVGCILFVLPFIPAWKDYFRAMPEYIYEEMHQGHHNMAAIEPLKPSVIEGADNIRICTSFNVDRLDTPYHVMKRFGIDITLNQSLLMFLLIMIVLSMLFFRFRKKISSPQTLFLFGFLSFILAELFSLAPRGAYNVIQWIFPISIIYLYGRKNPSIMVVLATALLLLHKFPYILPKQDMVAEFVFLVLTAYCIFFPASLIQSKNGLSRTG